MDEQQPPPQQITQQQRRRARIEEELLESPSNALDSWRIFRILAEFVSGFELLQRYSKAASIFGSSRAGTGDPIYEDAKELGGELAKNGFTIITGGGGGVMAGANQGAYESGGRSVGMNIRLSGNEEQTHNAYTQESEEFHYFFTRKVMLSFASDVYIFFPGGFGTLDEFFELITLIQTRKIQPIPIILVDRQHWRPLLEWINETLQKEHGMVDVEDVGIYHVVDSVDEAVQYIVQHTNHRGT